MKNLRESNLLMKEVFVQNSDGYGDMGFKHFVWGAIGLVLGGLVFGPLADYYSLWFLIGTIIFPLMVAMPQLARVHPLWSLESPPRWGSRTDVFDYPSDCFTEAKFYLALDKKDRRLYPSNIIELVKNQEITPEQRSELTNAMRRVRFSIKERNNAQAEIARRQIDVTGAVDFMNDNAATETEVNKVYKELS